MRRVIHSTNAFRVMWRRRASESMNATTPSSSVRLARTVRPERRMSGIATRIDLSGGDTCSIGLASTTRPPSPFGLRHIVVERFLGVHQGIVHGFSHGNDAREIWKGHSVGACLSVNERGVSGHQTSPLFRPSQPAFLAMDLATTGVTRRCRGSVKMPSTSGCR